MLLLLYMAVPAVVASAFGGPAVIARPNFDYETRTLTNADINRNKGVNFGNAEQVSDSETLPRCRAWPGTADWPTASEWAALNTTIDGNLLYPPIAASVCYPATPNYNLTGCNFLLNNASRTHFWIDDPLSTLTQWPQGSTCPLVRNGTGSCARGGFPEYVVNATTVKHVQAAVNFARNNNLRLVIKNTGHDFGGRSMGAGALSIWTHNLKDFSYIPSYQVGKYIGPAARYGAGMESWELFNHMARNNISLVAPGGATVGVGGGWLGAGGHGGLTSLLGLGSDQVLSINVVTADGQFRTLDPVTDYENLWWALRGGGPSTFGVITSVIAKVYPPLTTIFVPLTISLLPLGNPPPIPPATNPTPGLPSPPAPANIQTDSDTFWSAVSFSYRWCNNVVDAGGFCFSYIHPLGDGNFTFTSAQILSNLTAAQATTLMTPLYTGLRGVGVNITMPSITNNSVGSYAGNGQRNGNGDFPVNTRYRSRLFPRRNWEDDGLWNATWASIRAGVEEGGLLFHGIAYGPSREVAGWPGAESAVNPAWRETVLHGILMEDVPVGLTAAQARARDEHTYKYTDVWKALTPGAGSYMNEGDPAEKDWQWGFYGSNYRPLLRIKRRVDPWGVFWARTTVGSERWEVMTEDGFPAGQNGRLCRV